MSSTQESTKNIKGNRKVVYAKYYCDGCFKIPDGVDLEDKTVVKFWGIKYAKLHIHYVDGREEEIEHVWDVEPDWKYPEKVKIGDAEDYNIEYSDDEEEEEEEEEDEEDEEEEEEEIACVYNFHLCKYCCFQNRETEVDCENCGRKRCVFVYQEKNKREAIKAWFKN